jgi:hypothetical protein
MLLEQNKVITLRRKQPLRKHEFNQLLKKSQVCLFETFTPDSHWQTILEKIKHLNSKILTMIQSYLKFLQKLCGYHEII